MIAFFDSSAQTSGSRTVRISPTGAVRIDGVIEENEWREAAVFDLDGGGKVFFKYDGEHLFVGLRGVRKGLSHLYLSSGRKSDVAVLHASAALGASVYKPDKNQVWQPANQFSWELRDNIVTAETEKKFGEYLSKNFWMASNNNMGTPTDIEFQVKPRALAPKRLYAAVVYTSNAKDVQFFPAGLKDDALKSELLYGQTPPDLKFNTAQWAEIIFEKRLPKRSGE